MEVGKPSSAPQQPQHSLHLPTDRFSPVRRLSDGSPAMQRTPLTQQSSLPSSSDASPINDLRALQEECRKLQLENPAVPPTPVTSNNFLLRMKVAGTKLPQSSLNTRRSSSLNEYQKPSTQSLVSTRSKR